MAVGASHRPGPVPGRRDHRSPESAPCSPEPGLTSTFPPLGAPPHGGREDRRAPEATTGRSTCPDSENPYQHSPHIGRSASNGGSLRRGEDWRGGGLGQDLVPSVSSPATSSRACDSLAYGSPTPFTTGIRSAPPVPEGPGFNDGSVQDDQAQGVVGGGGNHRSAELPGAPVILGESPPFRIRAYEPIRPTSGVSSQPERAGPPGQERIQFPPRCSAQAARWSASVTPPPRTPNSVTSRPRRVTRARTKRGGPRGKRAVRPSDSCTR
ncbi:hypothetical protein QFZ76_008234 [Streptomyces sp. V4I2]|nr:hypothetical protein [Streptomyces sp. V4I2]